MAKLISLFNNKGGVGKTTLLFHIAHRLADDNRRVLMVDCDSQCNLTAYALQDDQISQAWASGGNSIYRQIEPLIRGIGDISCRPATKLDDNLYILPGDLLLSDFEDVLGDSWNPAKGGLESALRAQSAIFRLIKEAAEESEADIVLIDMGPNLGALNRATLSGSDYVIVPIAPDLFSIRGTENLGSKLEKWRKEWDQCNAAWDGDLEIPAGRPTFLGYVVQNHNIRSNAAGMTRGWQIFGKKVERAVQENIVGRLAPLKQAVRWDDGNYNLGQIPNLHSLVPYSQDARKPVFRCTTADGLTGAHIQRAKDSEDLFDDIVIAIANIIDGE